MELQLGKVRKLLAGYCGTAKVDASAKVGTAVLGRTEASASMESSIVYRSRIIS